MDSETRKAELKICVLKVILSQLLFLKCSIVLVPCSRLNNWHTFFTISEGRQPKKGFLQNTKSPSSENGIAHI